MPVSKEFENKLKKLIDKLKNITIQDLTLKFKKEGCKGVILQNGCEKKFIEFKNDVIETIDLCSQHEVIKVKDRWGAWRLRQSCIKDYDVLYEMSELGRWMGYCVRELGKSTYRRAPWFNDLTMAWCRAGDTLEKAFMNSLNAQSALSSTNEQSDEFNELMKGIASDIKKMTGSK